MIQTNFRNSILFLALSVCLCGVGHAQISGVPGDGIPDLYYFPADGLTAMTSMGPITRDAGVLTLDTDGATDGVGVIVIGPTPVLLLDDGSNLPLPDGSAATWTAGILSNGVQWLQTSPLSGPSFQGVIGTGYVDANGAVQPWPADNAVLNYPESGLANYGPGLTATDFGAGSFGGVTIVPEPAAVTMVFLAGLLCIVIRRRVAT